MKQIGDVQLFAEISSGATASVYKGYQPSLERTVLVKIMPVDFAADDNAMQEFLQEAKLLAKVQHPNVVLVYDAGFSAGRSYFTTEFVEGCDLRELLARRPLPPEIAWFIVSESVKGLLAIHERGILHHDVKPGNILISVDGQVKISDFGLAALRTAPASGFTEEISGTVAYFPPEKILGKATGEYSDIFSLGATFYEMLSGTKAFNGKNTDEYFNAILNTDPTGYLEKLKSIPTELRQICKKMLAKIVSERYQNCGAILADLTDFQNNYQVQIGQNGLKAFLQAPDSFAARPLERRPAPPAATPDRFKWRRPATGLLLLLLLIAASIFMNNRFKKTNPAAPNDSIKSIAVNELVVAQNSHEEAGKDAKRADLASAAKSDVKKNLDAVTATDTATTTDTRLPRHQDNSHGFLKITCKPWAQVFIDADSMGMTPFNRTLDLQPGRHKILFKNKDFPDHAATVDIQPGAETQMDFSFWDTVGTLELEVSPWAEVYIDGVLRDTVPPQTQPLILAPGEHKLKLRHPALGEWETKVRVKAGEALQLKFNLRNLIAR